MLKSFLEKLFRTMCPFVFTGATYTDYEVSGSMQIVAPYDGWVMLLASNVVDTTSLTLQCSHLISLIPCSGSAWGSVYVPCRKGQSITATVNGTGKPKLRIIRTALPE